LIQGGSRAVVMVIGLKAELLVRTRAEPVAAFLIWSTTSNMTTLPKTA
jgi:hypothetical protein